MVTIFHSKNMKEKRAKTHHNYDLSVNISPNSPNSPLKKQDARGTQSTTLRVMQKKLFFLLFPQSQTKIATHKPLLKKKSLSMSLFPFFCN